MRAPKSFIHEVFVATDMKYDELRPQINAKIELRKQTVCVDTRKRIYKQ